jgi:tripartite-type tricarboxylate transporter receptor subunit TctC
MQNRRILCSLTVLLAAMAGSIWPARGDSVSDFYKGKTVQFVVGYPPGGGYDVYSRLLARTLGKHIPGKPTVVLTNMPGAASLKAAQFLARAPGDGLTIGMFNRGLLPKSKLEPGEVNLDFSRFTWIGSMNGDVSICTVWGGTGIKDIAGLRAGKIVLADTAKNSGAYLYTSLLHNLFPKNTRMVMGYEGSSAIWLAMERGEVDANCNVWAAMKTQRPQWFANKKAAVLVQFSTTKHPDLADVPLISEIASSEDQKKALEFLTAADSIGRPIVGPPGMNHERALAIRAAFDAAMADPDLIAAAEQAQLELGAVNGEDAAKIANAISQVSDEVLAVVKKLVASEE